MDLWRKMQDFHVANLKSHVGDASQRLPSDAAALGDPPPLEASNAAEVSSAEATLKAQEAYLQGVASLTLPAASATPGGPQAGGVAAATAAPAGTSAATPKPGGPTVRRGDRVSYLGRQHPSMASAQERLDQLQAAIQRVELSSSQRARDYLPQLLVRRSLVQAQQTQRMPRVQASGAPPIGSRGRVVGVTGDKVGWAWCHCCASLGEGCAAGAHAGRWDGRAEHAGHVAQPVWSSVGRMGRTCRTRAMHWCCTWQRVLDLCLLGCSAPP